MKSPQLVRNILASAAVAAVLSIPHRATAADLQLKRTHRALFLFAEAFSFPHYTLLNGNGQEIDVADLDSKSIGLHSSNM